MIRLIRDELLIIVGTSSSETVLPRLLAKLQAAGASKQVTGLVIPTGYSFNLDGTCIYLTLGALFIVQATGQDMAIGEQIAMAGLMVLTSKGAAGITGAGLVTLTASLTAFGGTFFSPESIAVGIALVVGIDRIMSEGRALTNAIGNSVATMVIAGWQNERDDERFAARSCATRRSSTPRSSGRCAGETTTRPSRPGASSAAELPVDYAVIAAGGAVERVQRALDRHRHARERGRVALRVGGRLGGPQTLDEVEEHPRARALEGDDELLVVEPEGIRRVEVDARVRAADADVLLHDPPALLRVDPL